MTSSVKTLVVLAAATTAGCATVPREAGFGSVQSSVSERTGHLVQWRGRTAEDAAVDGAVRELLQKEMTADDAVQIALLNNRDLQATFEDLGIAQADLVQAGLLKNPVFAASWRFPNHSPSGTNAEYSVTQDFLDLIILPVRKKVAAQEFERTKLSVGHQVLHLAAEVKTAFYTVQARAQLLERLRFIAEINQTAAELAQRQREAGNLNDLGLANQQAVYDQSKIDLALSEAQLAADRERVNRLLGLWGDQTAWKVSSRLPPLPAQEIPIEHLESLAMRQRMDLAAAHAQVVAFGQALNLTEAHRYFTSVDVGIDTERDPGGQRVTGPTLDLQVPVFDQGQAQVARVQAKFRQVQRRFEAMAVNARSEVREARDRLLAQRTLADYYEALLPKRRQILDLTLHEYNGMLKGTHDLLLAKQNEVITERAYIEARRDYWIARVELERAVGGRLPAEAASTTQRAPATTQSSQSMRALPNDGAPSAPVQPHHMHEMKGVQP